MNSMAFSGNGKIWMNGKLVDWKDATIHVASHVVHYGSGVFEGIRCYDTARGTNLLPPRRAHAAAVDSCRVYRMDLPLDLEQLTRRGARDDSRQRASRPATSAR